MERDARFVVESSRPSKYDPQVRRAKNVIVVGLDCASPQLVFDTLADAMPFVSGLRARGVWGPLRSTVPPITVPAWACMTSGRDPGELGVYGFRARKRGSYRLSLVSAADVRVPRVWDLCTAQGLETAHLFVPPSYPLSPDTTGTSISCFLTPSSDHPHTAPDALASECRDRFGPYRMDVLGVRTGDPFALYNDILHMSEQHLEIAKHVLSTRNPDLLFFVDIGVDRFQHAFFHHLDPAHPRHDRSHPFVEKSRTYFAKIDAHIADLARIAGPDAAVLVVSDHGARPLLGGVCINEWLIDRGYLVLRHVPEKAEALRPEWIDWSRTRAWGEGGYHARIFINATDDCPEGIVGADERSSLAHEIANDIGHIRTSAGTIVKNRVVFPEHVFRALRGDPADLFVFFGDLAYRSIGTVGGGSLFVEGDDRGFDACNHDWDGIFVAAGAGVHERGARSGLSLHDVSASALSLLGVPLPADWLGRDVTAA